MIQRTGRLAVVALTAFLMAGCSVLEPDSVERDGAEVQGTGMVRWYDLEGGFHAIRGDDGVTYDPINLPEQFANDGLRVWFKGAIRDDMGSFHMVGPMVQLVEIRRR